MAIITGRLRRNSTHGPSGTAISAPTAGPTADRADTSASAGVQHQDGDQRESAEPEPRAVGADGVRRPQPAELPAQRPPACQASHLRFEQPAVEHADQSKDRSGPIKQLQPGRATTGS